MNNLFIRNLIWLILFWAHTIFTLMFKCIVRSYISYTRDVIYLESTKNEDQIHFQVINASCMFESITSLLIAIKLAYKTF